MYKLIYCLLLLITFTFEIVHAEETQYLSVLKQVEGTQKSGNAAERIAVTGSRIKRVNSEKAVPIQIIDRSEIENSGYLTLGEAIRELPVSSFGSTRELSNRGAPSFSSVKLRGLDAKYTLILLDGRRLAADPFFGSVDISDFPIAMIDRIEILKEGASAVYGSDAVGGVVNIKSREHVSGLQFSTYASVPTEKGGIEQRADSVGGGTFGNLGLTVGASVRNRETIFARDRSFIGDGWSNAGSPGSFVPISLVEKNGKKTWQPKGGFRADPRCNNTDLSRLTSVDQDTFCEYNFERVRTIAPSIHQKTLMFKSDYLINDGLSIYSFAKGSLRKSQDQIAPLPATNIDVTNPSAVDSLKTSLGEIGDNIDVAAGDGVRINYRTIEFGPRNTETDEQNFVGVLGLKGRYTENLNWDLSYSAHSIKRREMGKSGYWNKDILLKLMKDGNYDPFDPARTSDSLFQASFAPTEEQNADVYQINFLVDGELGELPAGPLSMAVGLSYLKESFSSTSDPLTQAGKIPGSSSNNGLGDRYTQSVFFEISAPIAQRFDSSLAMRFDDYERYGTGISPRLNLAYRSNDWLFRSSLGTGFRVPTLNEENVAEVTGAEPFVDYVRCNKVRETVSTKDSEFLCKESSYTVTIVAPKDLKTEKTAMASLGAVYEPKPALHLSLDAWYIQIKDRIGVPDYSLITKAEADGAQNLEQNGINIVRDNSQRIINLIAPAANLSTQELAGLDLSVMAKLGSKKQALFTYSIDGSYQIFNRLAAIEGQPLRNRIGNSDLPQWKVHNTMSMILAKDHRLSLTARTTSAMRKVNEDLGKVPAYSEYDLSYLLSDFFTGSLTAGVTNITNGKPPKDESASPTINYDLYSYRGRSYFAGLSQNF